MKNPAPIPTQTLVLQPDGTMSWSWLEWFKAVQSFMQSPTLANVPIYPNNAAALAGGLKPGQLYRAGTDPDVLYVTR